MQNNPHPEIATNRKTFLPILSSQPVRKRRWHAYFHGLDFGALSKKLGLQQVKRREHARNRSQEYRFVCGKIGASVGGSVGPARRSRFCGCRLLVYGESLRSRRPWAAHLGQQP